MTTNAAARYGFDPYLEWVLAHIDAKHQRVRYTGRPASDATSRAMHRLPRLSRAKIQSAPAWSSWMPYMPA